MTAVATSFTLKAAIGVSAYNAMCQSFSFISNIKVGTITLIMNSSLVLLQLVLQGKDFKKINFLQVVISFLFGIFFNFVYYDILGDFELTNYATRLTVFVIATIVLSFSVGIITTSNIVPFPPEAVCLVLEKRTKLSFATLRQLIDIIALVVTFLIFFIFKTPLPVREGTIILALVFAPMLGIFIPIIQKMFVKYELAV